jgi:hypothetical protein
VPVTSNPYILTLLPTFFHAGFLPSLFFRSWRWRRYVPPKRRLTLNRLQCVISQKVVLFIATAVRTSNPILIVCVPPLRKDNLFWYKMKGKAGVKKNSVALVR